jgi:hypothetical protein
MAKIFKMLPGNFAKITEGSDLDAPLVLRVHAMNDGTWEGKIGGMREYLTFKDETEALGWFMATAAGLLHI